MSAARFAMMSRPRARTASVSFVLRTPPSFRPRGFAAAGSGGLAGCAGWSSVGEARLRLGAAVMEQSTPYFVVDCQRVGGGTRLISG
jgi:hypothetical protein